MALNQFGVKTSPAVIYKHESHKLHQAFDMKVAEPSTGVIFPGVPCSLNTDGSISPLGYTGGTDLFIGIAVTDGENPAYGSKFTGSTADPSGWSEVTVMTEAFALIRGKAKAAGISAGYVKPSTSNLSNFSSDIYVEYEASETETHFINITPVDEVGDIMHILVR